MRGHAEPCHEGAVFRAFDDLDRDLRSKEDPGADWLTSASADFIHHIDLSRTRRDAPNMDRTPIHVLVPIM